MITLEQLNAQVTAWRTVTGSSDVHEWSGWTLRRSYAVGKCGSQNGRRGRAGAKAHLLHVEIVEAVNEPKYAGRVGQYHRITGCNGNGQFTGTIVEGAELEAITCAKCKAKLALILERTAAK